MRVRQSRNRPFRGVECPEKIFDFQCRFRLAEKVTLGFRTSFRYQHFELASILDAFC
jgi:hypothetical protein